MALPRNLLLLVPALVALCGAAASKQQKQQHHHRLRQPLVDDGHHGGTLFAVDLTHPLSELAPVTDGASPLEMSREELDEHNGARYAHRGRAK